MNTTTDIDTCSVSELIEAGYYEPISLYFCDNGMIKYKPVHYEKDLIQYDLSVSQVQYPDGSYGQLYIHIKSDDTKNIIKNRWEILDL
jgi:hypothetical protein